MCSDRLPDQIVMRVQRRIRRDPWIQGFVVKSEQGLAQREGRHRMREGASPPCACPGLGAVGLGVALAAGVEPGVMCDPSD